MFQNVILAKQYSLSSPPMLPYYPRLIDAVYPAGLDAGDYTVTSISRSQTAHWIQRRLLLPSGRPAVDINRDGVCNIYDLVLLGQLLGRNRYSRWVPEDINSDDVVNIYDLVILGNHWGQTW